MDLLAWQRRIGERWSEVRFGAVNVQSVNGDLNFAVDVYLAGLNPSDVRVELYAEAQSGGAEFRQEMERKQQSAADPAAYVYSVRVPATRPAGDFTPRVIAYHPLATGLEVSRIVWQK